jgi:hypothetical protein
LKAQVYVVCEKLTCIVGDKLRVCGAELVANQQAEALESAKTSYLNLHSNGVHRLAEHLRMQLDVLHCHTSF